MDFSLSEDQQLMVDGFTRTSESRSWEKYARGSMNARYPRMGFGNFASSALTRSSFPRRTAVWVCQLE